MVDFVGLSPRPRGNHCHVVLVDDAAGPIPASAGEPACRCGTTPALRAYPRVRGGTKRLGLMRSVAEGLSPRPRGNPQQAQGEVVGGGPIPASAGEPAALSRWSAPWWAYPRVRGGTRHGEPGTGVLLGLSPRPRGNPCDEMNGSAHGGPIPASAGEPLWWQRNRRLERAYPRVRGGTMLGRDALGRSAGLSPRPRGNLCGLGVDGNGYGPIPASAGEPSSERSSSCSPWAYPRVRGGTTRKLLDAIGVEGLSPRPRGNHRYVVDNILPGGPIPASAGEP